MKKTTLLDSSFLDSLPHLLWEKKGIRYPLLSGYRVRPLKGSELISMGEEGAFKQIRYLRKGYRVIWDSPSADLSPSLHRLWNHAREQGLVRLWVKKNHTGEYQGFWTNVLFPSHWEGEFLDPLVPFSLSFWI
jgi:hypothetical protein